MASLQAINDTKRKAQEQFNHDRVVKLSSNFYPETAYHPDFKSTLHKLLKFNCAKAMGILMPSWKNMCTFEREFFMVEMEVCLRILECATPMEICTPISLNDFNDEELLKRYNEIEYPKIVAILNDMKAMYYKIDKALSEPIARKINADCKISLQLPIGTDISFVQQPLHG